MSQCKPIKRGAHVPISDTLTIVYQDASKDAITNYKANPNAA